jgi:hypothetical protein
VVTENKREIYIFLLVLYGVLAIPAAGLTRLSLTTFNSLSAIYVIFNTIGTVVTTIQNIFIPYTMQQAAPIDTLSTKSRNEVLLHGEDEEIKRLNTARELEGLKISVWGYNSLAAGTAIFLAITIGVSKVNADTQVNAGLYVTTASGVLCVACALVGWKCLPSPAAKPWDKDVSIWKLPFLTC